MLPIKGLPYTFYVALRSQADSTLFQANPTLAAGDVKVSIDGGALANLATLPTVTPAGGKLVKVVLDGTEMNGEDVSVVFSDAAGAEWMDLVIPIQPADLRVLGIASIGVLAAGSASGFTLPDDGNRARVKAGMLIHIPTKGILARAIATYDSGTGVGTPDTNFDSAAAASDPYVVYVQASAPPTTALPQVSVKRVNDVTLQGDGTVGDPWRPA